MENVIIYTNAIGGVSVCAPTGEIPIEDVVEKDIPPGVQSYIVSAKSLPENDNDFFNAWEQTNGIVSINFDKAKELTKSRLRMERAPLLLEQDVAFQRAQEAGTDTSAIVAEKTRLRNLPELADGCLTLEELRALQP